VFTIASPYAPDPFPSLHTVNFAGVLAFGEAMGMPLPRLVHVLTVEAEDIETFREGCTPAIEAAIPEAAETLIRLIRRRLPDLKTVSPRRSAQVARPAVIPV
jgi:Ni,Fe-hydrogenase maturation factor